MVNRIESTFTKVNAVVDVILRHCCLLLADEIHHAYLAGLNTRILLHEYGSYQQCPAELHVRVEAIESHFMTEVSGLR